MVKPGPRRSPARSLHARGRLYRSWAPACRSRGSLAPAGRDGVVWDAPVKPSSPQSRACGEDGPGESGWADLLGVLAGDLDLARFGRFVHGDGQGQHAGGVVGGDVVAVVSVAEEHLPGEGARGALADLQLLLALRAWPGRVHGEHVLLHGQLDCIQGGAG